MRPTNRFSPEGWLRDVFASRAVQQGQVIRRQKRDIEHYVGMPLFLREIRERGFQKNSLSKLFAPLTASGEESLEYFEEWAVRSGIYGSSENVQQIELNLEEKKMIASPQPVEFVDNLPAEQFDNIFRVLPSDLLDRPQEYTSSVFPVLAFLKALSGTPPTSTVSISKGAVGAISWATASK